MTFAEFSRLILAAAASERRFTNWVVMRTVDSSNSLAKRLAVSAFEDEEEPRPAVIVAWQQTAGRGRLKHQWNSPAGLGVYTSLLLPAVSRQRLPLLPLSTAVGLARGLERYLDSPAGGRRLGLRWPNDLLVGGRKMGGILIEVVANGGREPAVVVGYGVNHGQTLENLPDVNATSVALEAPLPPGLPELVVELAGCIAEELEDLEDAASVVGRFSDRLVHREGDPLRCRTAGGVVRGSFAGLDERGFLRLRTGTEVRTLAAGEVMDATEADSERSSREPGDESDHSYFRAIEEVFIRLRGAPFLLSPEDWRVASGWRRDGIPLATAAAVLERIFGEREGAGRGGRSISGLRYFNRAVRAAWGERQAMVGAEGSRQAEPLDVAARLRSLAEAVAGIAEEGDSRLGARILALRGTTEEVETRLAELDVEMLEMVRKQLSGEERSRLEAGVESGVARIRTPLKPEEEAEIRGRLERQALRRECDLPLLSLFSPAAE